MFGHPPNGRHSNTAFCSELNTQIPQKTVLPQHQGCQGAAQNYTSWSWLSALLDTHEVVKLDAKPHIGKDPIHIAKLDLPGLERRSDGCDGCDSCGHGSIQTNKHLRNLVRIWEDLATKFSVYVGIIRSFICRPLK